MGRCALIIEGGSCANVASKNMAEKLKPAVSPHPSLYTIQWLNQGKGMYISYQCLLALSIGKHYKRELWRDIMPTNACHILLERPSLFNKRVMHDGRLNTYTFAKDHKKITLTPLKSTS